MWKDIQDALLSVGEVAVFAWSLLELLLTRILPLAGFLAGHLLLQFCRLLAAFVIAAAGWREPQEYSCDWKAEVLIEEGDVQVVKGDGDHQNDLKSLKGSDKHEESLLLPSVIDATDAAMPVADATAIIADATPELAAEQVDVSGSAPSDAAANEMQVRGNDDGHVASETERFDLGSKVADVVGEEQRHMSANPESSMDLEASDVQRSSTDGEMGKSRRMMRVLPPSLSQIKRVLIQRPRRASPIPGSTPSPMKKKHNISPRSRKVASLAIKS